MTDEPASSLPSNGAELVMTTETDRLPPLETANTLRHLRTVAVVARNQCANVLDAALGAGDYDVVFIESIDRAYSQIKRCTPDVVILCLEMDDPGCFQILSMLKMDRVTADIPVITYMLEADAMSSDDDSCEMEPDSPSERVIVSTD